MASLSLEPAEVLTVLTAWAQAPRADRPELDALWWARGPRAGRSWVKRQLGIDTKPKGRAAIQARTDEGEIDELRRLGVISTAAPLRVVGSES